MEDYKIGKPNWKKGSFFPVDAQVAADTICDLQQKLGKDTVTAKELLDASRDENAALHGCFEWDDSIAAEKYRVWQARHLIQCLEVPIIRPAEPPVTIRAFLNITQPAPKHEGQFVGIQRIIENTDYRKQVLSIALSELRSFQRKYSAYEELSGVCKAIDAFADTVQ